MTPIERIRNTTTLLSLGLLAIQIPVLIVAPWIVSGAVGWFGPLSSAVLTLLGLAAWRLLPAQVTQWLLAMLLPMAGLVSVVTFHGQTSWQTGMQIYSYVLLAVITGTCNWRQVALGAATLAAGFFIGGLLVPKELGVDGESLLNLLVYPWFAAFEGTLMGWIAATLSQALHQSQAALADAQAAHAEVARAAAEREASAETARLERGRVLLQVASQLEHQVGSLARRVADAAASAEADAEGLRGLVRAGSDQSHAVHRAGDDAVSSAGAVAAAAGQLSAAITEIATQIARSSAETRGAAAHARDTRAIVLGLTEAATSIEGVLRTISEIAEHTQLLALNATIEAARAGEAGKGFAVVASEVKNLAGQTARATSEVGEKVLAIRETTDRAGKAIETIATAIFDLDNVTAAIAAAVEEQDSATREIARSARQAAESAEASATGGSAMVDAWNETDRSADSITRLSETLGEETRQLLNAVDGFVHQIRDSAR